MKRKVRRKQSGWKRFLKNKWTAFTVITILIMGALVYYFFFSHIIAVYEAIPRTAAIVDQLSMTNPNATFVSSATNILTSAGFTVDYYNYSEVTVDFYAQLPSKRYSLIILRVHSGVGQYSGLTTLYTTENQSQWAHYWEQMNNEVVSVEYVTGGPIYFGITSSFVKKFDICKNSVIIMMGCNGIEKTDMAEAYVEKGAEAYISWDGSISPAHTDKTTEELLRNIVSRNQTIGNAVNNVMYTIGPDPQYESRLAFYPAEANGYVLLETPENLKRPFILLLDRWRQSALRSLFSFISKNA